MKSFTTFFSKIAKGNTTEKEIRKVLNRVANNPEWESELNWELLSNKPKLPNSEALTHIAFLKYVWMGKTNRALKGNPFSKEQCKEINNACGISVSGILLHELAGEQIALPIYQLLLKKGGKEDLGFRFYKTGNTIKPMQ